MTQYQHGRASASGARGSDTGGVSQPDPDAVYAPFPSLATWGEARVNWQLWADTQWRVAEAQRAVSTNIAADERERSLRAAALNTGALEGLHHADRGLTVTVVTDAAWRDAIERAEGGAATRFVEAAIDAYDLVLDLATGAQQQLSEAVIRRLHEIVVSPQDTYDAQTSLGRQAVALPKGEYKRQPNHVIEPDGTLHAYAPPDRVPDEMHRLVSELSTDEVASAHPVVLAAFAHHALVAVHPFADGNGRVARLLASVYLLRAASVPLMIWADQSVEYRKALKEADTARPQAFVDFVFDRSIDAMNLMADRLRTRAAEDRIESRATGGLTLTSRSGAFRRERQLGAAERLLEIVGRCARGVVERGRAGYALVFDEAEVFYTGGGTDVPFGRAQRLHATHGNANGVCDLVVLFPRHDDESVVLEVSGSGDRRPFRVADLEPELKSSAAQQIEDFVVRACTEFLADLAG